MRNDLLDFYERAPLIELGAGPIGCGAKSIRTTL
jgi:hypothetical protein